MPSEHPLKGSLATLLSVTLSANPLAALSVPSLPENNGDASRDVPELIEKSVLYPGARVLATGISQGKDALSTPDFAGSTLSQFPLNPQRAEREPFAHLKPPPIIGLFTDSSFLPESPVLSDQPSVRVKDTSASSHAKVIGTSRSLFPAGPIPLRELESWVQFGEVKSSWLERRKAAKTNWFQQLGATVQRSLHRDPAVELSRRAIMRIQSTPEGREVLEQLQEEYRRTNRKLIIASADFRDSGIIRNNGVETINGMRGQANPIEGIYLFNRKFLEFRDRETALEYLCGNMSHEMRHLVSRGQIDRLSGRAGAAFSHAFIDEQRARLTGYLVAARLNKGKPTDYSDEARSWARSPKAFWDEMKSWSIYAHNLDMDEMRDPIRAFTQRIIMLRKAIQENDANISVHLPRIGDQIDILEQKEGLKGQLKEVRRTFENLRSNEPGERASNKQMLYLITELRRTLSSPEGENLLRSYQSAPDDPAFRILQQGLARDEETLRDLIKAKRLPRFSPKRGQLSWDEFKERVRISQRENPEYWVEHRARFPIHK